MNNFYIFEAADRAAYVRRIGRYYYAVVEVTVTTKNYPGEVTVEFTNPEAAQEFLNTYVSEQHHE